MNVVLMPLLLMLDKYLFCTENKISYVQHNVGEMTKYYKLMAFWTNVILP